MSAHESDTYVHVVVVNALRENWIPGTGVIDGCEAQC